MEAQTNQKLQDSLRNNLGQLASEHGDRILAIQWLSKHPQIARAPLRDIILEPNQTWKASGAIKALGMIGDVEDVVFLQEILQNNLSLSFEAASALANIKEATSREALLQLTDHPNESVAANAIIGLGLTQDETMRPHLEKLLDSPSATLRWKAVHAIGLLGTGSSEALLRKLSQTDPDQNVRTKINSVLK
ncbi:MAG: HEAT repeat domain-containing protein [Bacteroidia bacterium]|nr:HEAT repeat domain-containing protein [Bacteroidia bacterium]